MVDACESGFDEEWRGPEFRNVITHFSPLPCTSVQQVDPQIDELWQAA